MTDVYATILEWSKGKKIPVWERDALRRIVVSAGLSADDENDLVEMAKQENGIQSTATSTPVPLASTHVSQAQSATEAVVLTAMHGLKHVNALAEDQTLTFAERGITVVYGENGTGKSGYSRVLRRACRARQAPDVLGKVDSSTPGTPEARFLVKSGTSTPRDVAWVQGASSPDELATFCVFDRECEKAFVDHEDELTFLPGGLGVLQELANLVSKVRQRIANEAIAMKPTDTLDDVRREVTAPADAVSLLAGVRSGPTSKDFKAALEQLDKICATDEEMARLDQLDQRLAELRLNDPAKKAAELRRLADRLESQCLAWRTAAGNLDAAAIEQLIRLHEEKQKAVSAAAVVDGSPAAPGIGSDPWRELYAAAARYATAHLHPGSEFPDVTEGAACPLCLQTLSADARDRFTRFRDFMARRAETIAKEADAALLAAVETIRKLQIDTLDEMFIARLEELTEQSAAASARAIPAALKTRRDAITAAIGSNSWNTVPGLDLSALDSLDPLPSTLRLQADEAAKLADPAAKRALEVERAGLSGKLTMRKQRDRIANVITSFRDAAVLSECSNKINTNAITAKVTEIANDILTKGLASAFKEEMVALGAADRVEVSIGHRGGARGRSLYGLSLAGATPGKWQRSEVLSEGEQRVVALAYFLAEARLAASPVGIIVDDPVSSLDHRWSDAVAQRLVNLARDRQVIVFTHNISFFVELERVATEQSIQLHPQFIVRRKRVPGHCDPASSPWERLSVKTRLAAMDEDLKKIRSMFDSDPDTPAYGASFSAFTDRLRAAWERAVEEIVLNKTVERFGCGVKTQSLNGVVCDDETFKTVYDAMTRLSGLTEAHDKASRSLGTCPPVSALVKEVQALRDFNKIHKQKKTAAETARRLLQSPPEPTASSPDGCATA